MMCKSLLAMALLASLAFVQASASDSALSASERATCVSDAAAYLSTAIIDASLAPLIAASRSVYPDVMVMIEEDVPEGAYEVALQKVGSQPGCAKVEEHVQMMSDLVPCYSDIEADEDSLLDIARANEDAKKVIEAHMACAFSQ